MSRIENARREALELIERARYHVPIHYDGGCPHCGSNDGMLNICKYYACFCQQHKTYWWINTNIYSGWQQQDPAVWDANAALLGTYTEVRPVFEQAPPGPTSQDDRFS